MPERRQTAGILVGEARNFEEKVILAKITRATFHRLVRPGDTIQPVGTVRSKQTTAKSHWVLIDVTVCNQTGEKVASGEAMVEFPAT